MIRRPTMSLRARLLAGMGLVAVVLIVVSAFVTVTIRDLLIGQIDDRLSSFSPAGRVGEFEPFPGPQLTTSIGDGAGSTASGSAASGGTITVISGDATQAVPAPPGGGGPIQAPERASDAYQGFVRDGVLTTRFAPNVGDVESSAPDLEGTDLPDEGGSFFTASSVGGEVTYRVLAERIGDSVLITALPLDDVTDTISQLVWVEVLGCMLILAALGLVSWWVIHLGIKPVKEMTHTATRIADGDLAVRVPESANGTESAELAVALNRMLGHIEGALDERAASEDRLRRFVADASHELRTPVTTIRGYAELYRHGGLADHDALDDAMRRTEQEAVRMGRLVEDMLVLAKFDEERVLEVAPVDLARLVDDAGADARAAWPGRSIVIEGADEPAVIEGDEDRLRQVIANVVGNALVHTEPGIEVVVRVERSAGSVAVEVRDAGHGMPPEVAARVTERFYRADPARARNRGGSGLGLAIVDAAVSAHDGTVTIESEPDVGTTVRLSFPTDAARA